MEIDEQGRINLSMKFGPDAGTSRGGWREGGFEGGAGGRGEDRPYHPRARPSFPSRGGRPPMRGPRHDDLDTGKERSAHPLAMQFRREREEQFRRDRSTRGPRPFKKTHY